MKLIGPEERANARRKENTAGHSPANSKKREVTTPQFSGIIESNMAPYVHLVCEHITTRDEIIATSLWRPSQDKYYCDKCGKWVKQMPKPIYITPDEPMF